MSERRREFLELTARCNSGAASPEEYESWCELHSELRSVDLGARRVKERQFLRAEVDMEVELQVGGRRQTGRCVELGAGGMLIELPIALEPGARALLLFRLPGDLETWKVQAAVVWSDTIAGRAGLRFEGLSEEATDELRAAVLAELLVRLHAAEEA